MEEKKKVLKNIYDVINRIARNHEKKGEDTSSWFYTSKEVKELRKNGSKIFV